MAWAEGVDRWNPREGAGRKRFRRGSEGTPPGKTGWKLRVSQHPAAPCWGSAIWPKQSLGEGGAEASAAKLGDGRAHGLAENGDWRQETGRERRGRLPTRVGRRRWAKDPVA